MFTVAQHLYSLAAAAYLMAALVAAAIRWFHLCAPGDKDPAYYYPGRPYFVIAHLSALVLLPYILNPCNSDAWYLARVFCLPVLLYFLSALMFGYFGNVMHWKNWKWATALTGIPAILPLAAALVLILIPGEQTESVRLSRIANATIFMAGGLESLVCLYAVRTVYTWIKRDDSDEFSNPEDFPVTFARKMIVLLLLTAVLLWTAAIANSQLALALLNLLLAVLSVLFTIYTLPPQRKGVVNARPEPKEASKQVYVRQIPESRVLEILSGIAEVVLEREAFLNPHLTIQDVADRCGYNRTYVAGVFKSELGGFFNYINNLRLDYAEKYIQEHPKASIQEVATESGFSSRQTYYTVKAKLRGKQ